MIWREKSKYLNMDAANVVGVTAAHLLIGIQKCLIPSLKLEYFFPHKSSNRFAESRAKLHVSVLIRVAVKQKTTFVSFSSFDLRKI